MPGKNMPGKSLLKVVLSLVALGFLLLVVDNAIASGPQERTLFTFSLAQGGAPFEMDGLILGAGGKLYGTARGGGPQGYGVVFALSPPSVAGGQWTESTLYNFQNGSDGYFPMGGLTFDSAGNLYGTTAYGGGSGNGSVFELSPPTIAGGAWTETTLHHFVGGSDGEVPVCGVILDRNGNLYGTTYYGGSSGLGTVYELSPPAVQGGPWTESILHTFSGGNVNAPAGAYPNGGLILTTHGALIGTTDSGGLAWNGVVFELDPPTGGTGSWHEQRLYAFTGSDGASPFGSLALGPSGSFYGVTLNGGLGNGVVYQMTPPATQGGSWTETALYAFTGGADQGLPLSVIFHSGNLYGTTGGVNGSYGTVYELIPQGSAWTETTLHAFTNTDGNYPSARLLSLNGGFYGTTLSGGRNGQGVFFEVIP